MVAYLIIALFGAHAALGDDSIRGEAAPLALWASIRENRTAVKPLYASMAGHDPASGKNWTSKPKQQVNAWNKTMQHTYHTYIPSSYQKLPSKAADIRASSAASSDEQKFTGYSSQYGGLAKIAMRGAKNDFHQRSRTSTGAMSDVPEMHEYADRYSSRQSSHDTDYKTCLKDYAGNEKGQDGEKYMKASGSTGSSVPDYQHFAGSSYASGDQGKSDQKKPYQKYMRGRSSWDEQYGHSSGWKTQLSGVVPSFVPRFVADPGAQALGSARAEAVDATQLPSSQDGLRQWYWLATASLTGLALVAGVQLGRRRRRTVHPPENLLG